MGKSNDQVIGYKYFTNFLLFIGNPIEKLLGINFDKRGWIDPFTDEDENILDPGVINSPTLYGETEGGVAGAVYLKTGTNEQEVVPFYKDYMESKELQASAYPYQSYLAFKDFYVGNSGYMKEMLLWPKRIHVRNDGRAQWYNEKAEIKDYTVVPGECSEIIGFYGGTSTYWRGIGNILDLRLLTSASSFRYVGSESKGACVLEFRFEHASSTAQQIEMSLLFAACSSVAVESSSFVKVIDFTITSNDMSAVYWDKECTVRFSVEPHKKTESWIRIICNFIDYVHPIYYPAGKNSDFYFSHWVTIQHTSGYVCWGGEDSGDINPIHKIREILTDDTAMNKPESSVNNLNFMKAADRIYDEGLGISWSITEKSCIDAINELCYHIEAGIRVNRQTGLYEMILFRDDWFEEDEIHSISESKIKSMQYEITNADEVINQVNVNFYDRANIKNSSFSISESGLIQTLGRVNAETVDFPYFMNMRNAEIVANWKLKLLSTGVYKGTFTTGWHEARKWNRYDLIRLPWSRRWSETILVRIMSINLGGPTNNEVSIDFIEVVPATGMMNTTIVADDVIDKPLPPQACEYEPFEMPYYLAVMALGQRQVDEELAYDSNFGLVGVVAEKPQENSLYAVMMTNNYDEWVRAGSIQYSKTVDLDQVISKTSTSFTVKNWKNITNVPAGTLIQCGKEWLTGLSEWMVFQGIDPHTGVVSVKRGALDTTPQEWDSGLKLYFCGNDVTYDETEYASGEKVLVSALTTTPSGVLEQKGSNKVEMKARAIRPYPPANVKINGEYSLEDVSSNVTVTWVDRNRLQQTGGDILGWYEGGVTRESGVVYEFETVAEDSTIVSSGSSVESGLILEQADFYPKATLKIWSKRDGYRSAHPVEIELISSIGLITQFMELIYAKNEYIELQAKLSNNLAVSTAHIVSGSMPTGWMLSSEGVITGKATTDGTYTFTLQVSDPFSNLIQKTFSVKIQGTTWSQLRFNSQNMTDDVGGNSWSQGVGNIFDAGYETGYALKMGGTSAPTLAKSLLTTTSFSVSCWIKVTKVATDYIPILYFGLSSDNMNRDCMYLIPDGSGGNKLRCYRQAGSGTSATFDSPSSIPLNMWTKLSYTISGSNQKMYVNDVLVASSIYSNSITSFANFYLGLVRASSTLIYRDGVIIDNVLVTTGALRYE